MMLTYIPPFSLHHPLSYSPDAYIPSFSYFTIHDHRRGITVQTVRGQKKLFGSRNDDELEASVSLTSVDPLRIGRPLALADDVVGDYMRCIGASPPGQRAWTQGLGLGLLGTLALQDLCGPLIEGLLSTQFKQYISRK